MSRYKEPDFLERQTRARTARKKSAEKFHKAAKDPSVAEHQARRSAVHEARQSRIADREAVRKAQEAELLEAVAVDAVLEADVRSLQEWRDSQKADS